MKITKSQLKHIIKEEIAETLNEAEFGERDPRPDPRLLKFADAILDMLYDNRFDDIVDYNGPLPLGDDNDDSYKRKDNSLRVFALKLAERGLTYGMQSMPQTYEDLEDFYQFMAQSKPEPKPEPEPEPQQGFSGSYQERSKKAEELYNEYKDQAAQDLLYTDMGEDVVAVQESEAVSYLGSLLGKNANPPIRGDADARDPQLRVGIIDTIEKGWSDGYMEYQVRDEFYGDYD